MSSLSSWDAMRNYGRENGFSESEFCDLETMVAVEYRGLHLGERFRRQAFILCLFAYSTDRY